MDFNPDEHSDKEVKELSLKNGEGFEIVFEKKEDRDDVRVWQKLYGETVFIMTIDRHSLGDLIYALEDML
jgi:hypothetical protein